MTTPQPRQCIECGASVRPRKGRWLNSTRCWDCAKRREVAVRQVGLIMHRALKSGVLVRSACEVCGSEKSDGHHDDYAKPLSVRWLCRTHHKQHHAKFGPGINAHINQGEKA